MPDSHAPATATPTSRGSGISRRRALQGAAWSVPAITLATAAPAHAVSVNEPNVSSATTVITNGGQVQHRIVLTNAGSAATTALQVNCVLEYSGISPRAYNFAEFFNTISPGWVLQGDGLASGKTLDVTFLRTGTQLPGGAAVSLDFTCVQPAPPVGTTTTTPSPTPGTGVASVAVWA